MNQKQLYILMFLLMVIVLFQNRRVSVHPRQDNLEMAQNSEGQELNHYANSENSKNISSGHKNIPYKVGLALSGGGIKGFCHVGVLKALDEKGIHPDIMSGVSSGAIVAALYADGYSPDSIVTIFDKIHLVEYFRIDFLNGGFMGMEGFKHLLNTVLHANTFEELSIPLRIVATDLDNGQSVVFDSGNLVDALAATCSVPILFSPYVIDGVNYVDGGILKNLPASTIRSDCKVIIGVSSGPLDADSYQKSITNIALRSYKLIFRSNTTREKGLCDILIEPAGIGNFNGVSLNRVKDIFDIGYNETIKILNTEKSEKLLNP